MAMFRPALAGAAILVASIVSPLAALAATPIAVVDYGRVYKESNAGKSAQAQLKAIQDKIGAELSPEENTLTNDKKSLEPRFQGKSAQQINAMLQSDKELGSKFTSYQQHLQNFMQRKELRDREMQATAQKALSDVLSQAQPSVEEARSAKNAAVVLEASNVVAHDPNTDITNDVIARFNAKVQTVSVTLIEPKQQ